MTATTATQPIRTFADFDLAGYRPGFPPWGTERVREIDARAAYGSACERCGHVGGTYHPYHSIDATPGERSYRAFVICTGCGQVEEY